MIKGKASQLYTHSLDKLASFKQLQHQFDAYTLKKKWDILETLWIRLLI